MKKALACALLVLAGCASGTRPAPKPAQTATQPAPLSPGWDIANLPFWRVDYWIERFSTGDKHDEFAGYLARKADYHAMISEKLRVRHMPQDLLYLPMIESGFNPQASSAAGAAGIWQLTADTARRYKLRVDDTVDERRDPEKATEAALEYLADLYGRFGSWYLAAAAYNTGENRVGRAMTEVTGSEFGTDADYYRIWDRLPGETRDFVPVMIAAAAISKDPAKYGF